MDPVVVTGSASGIGAAVRARLERAGTPVIGVDLRDAEVIADLSLDAGRTAAVAGARAHAGGRLAGVVACAGVGPHIEARALIPAINYFGARTVLEGLRDTLAAGGAGAAVAIGSNSAALPGADG